MNDNTTLRMMIATAALAAVAALFAGGANAMLLDVEGGSGGGASAVPATQPQTIPYLSHGIGVDESQFSGQASSKLTGVHAALAGNREPAAAASVEPGTIPYLSHGIGVDESQFSGQAWGGQVSLGLTGDSALTRVDRGTQVAGDGLDPAIRTAIAAHASDSAVTVEQQHDPLPQPRDRRRRGPVQRPGVARAHGRLPADAGLGSRARGPDGRLGCYAVSGDHLAAGHLRRERHRLDVVRSRSRDGGSARRRARRRPAQHAQSQQGCTPVATVRHGNRGGAVGGTAPSRWSVPGSRAALFHHRDARTRTSSGTQDSAARPGQEARLDEQGQRVALDDRPPVEALDREPAAAIRSDPADEGGERRAEPVAVGVAERQQRPAAALDVEHGLTAEEDDVRAGDARGPRRGALRPRQDAAVRLCRIGGRQDERLVVVEVAQLPEALDGAGKRELGPAEPFDEVAAAAGADGLERLQLSVHGAVPAGDPLRPDTVARHDPLPLEQELRQRAPVGGT